MIQGLVRFAVTPYTGKDNLLLSWRWFPILKRTVGFNSMFRSVCSNKKIKINLPINKSKIDNLLSLVFCWFQRPCWIVSHPYIKSNSKKKRENPDEISQILNHVRLPILPFIFLSKCWTMFAALPGITNVKCRSNWIPIGKSSNYNFFPCEVF